MSPRVPVAACRRTGAADRRCVNVGGGVVVRSERRRKRCWTRWGRRKRWRSIDKNEKKERVMSVTGSLFSRRRLGGVLGSSRKGTRCGVPPVPPPSPMVEHYFSLHSPSLARARLFFNILRVSIASSTTTFVRVNTRHSATLTTLSSSSSASRSLFVVSEWPDSPGRNNAARTHRFPFQKRRPCVLNRATSIRSGGS